MVWKNITKIFLFILILNLDTFVVIKLIHRSGHNFSTQTQIHNKQLLLLLYNHFTLARVLSQKASFTFFFYSENYFIVKNVINIMVMSYGYWLLYKKKFLVISYEFISVYVLLSQASNIRNKVIYNI